MNLKEMLGSLQTDIFPVSVPIQTQEPVEKRGAGEIAPVRMVGLEKCLNNLGSKMRSRLLRVGRSDKNQPVPGKKRESLEVESPARHRSISTVLQNPGTILKSLMLDAGEAKKSRARTLLFLTSHLLFPTKIQEAGEQGGGGEITSVCRNENQPYTRQIF